MPGMLGFVVSVAQQEEAELHTWKRCGNFSFFCGVDVLRI
jgi:hypothetical protein